jgi:hypothetical protein
MFPQPPLIPELAELDQQMMFAVDPQQRPQLEKALADAQARLASVDKSNLQQYAGAMQQVVMLKRRLESNVTPQSLLSQRITILETLIQ